MTTIELDHTLKPVAFAWPGGYPVFYIALEGWTNYETWLVKLWIDNDEGSYNYWRETAEEHFKTDGDDASQSLADRLKEEHASVIHDTCLKPSGMEASFIADLLNAAMSEVNWHEIADSLIESAKEALA